MSVCSSGPPDSARAIRRWSGRGSIGHALFQAAADSAHAAAGFCVLKQNPNGTYYCEKGTCTGNCTRYNFPVRCSCS
jgi:hypothetical protein